MNFIDHYHSPLGDLLTVADETGLIGLWFKGEKDFAHSLSADPAERQTPILLETRRWLDIYFSGKDPGFLPPLQFKGSSFQKAIWKLLLQIPYGHTTTYGEIGRKFAEKQGIRKMSAQAVGGAVSHNEISIIIPCHRVIGADGSLTGYAAGLEKKAQLLALEGVSLARPHLWSFPYID